MLYCVHTSGPGIALRGARVTLLHFADGGMKVHYKTKVLPWTAVKPANASQHRAQPSIPQGCG